MKNKEDERLSLMKTNIKEIYEKIRAIILFVSFYKNYFIIPIKYYIIKL